jgi:phosphosulfolactate synthase (CoM biosynthesis protein A)
MAKPSIPTLDRAFDFLKINERPAKPRSRGVTEIRGPYYTPMGKHYLQDVLETMGVYVDVLKFAGGSFSLMPRKAVKERAIPNGQSRRPSVLSMPVRT